MPVVPTPPTIQDGTTSSSTFNQFRDAIRFLESPPIAHLRQVAAQSIANATSVSIAFDTEDVDTDIDGTGGHSNVTNNTRFTARYSGWYMISGGITYASNATGYRSVDIAINGNFVNGCSALLPTVNGNSTRVPSRRMLIYLAAGDYVEIYAFQTSGGALNTGVTGVEQSTMTIKWVSL